MTDPASARVFISYSRKDGAAFAASLGKKLLRQNLSVWRDIVALEGGRDWWSQIEDAIRSKALQHFVLVVTQGALESPVVRREIHLSGECRFSAYVAVTRTSTRHSIITPLAQS